MTAPISADEARRLREAATPGPWVIDKDGDVVHPVSDNSKDDEPVVIVEFWPLGPEVYADQALIAAAPDLAAEVERLTADNERLRGALRRIASEDYRGPKPHGAAIAAATLADEGEK